MAKTEVLFEEIIKMALELDPGVSQGKMMSAPGLKYKDKVFAFYHKNEMDFRLGPNFNAEKFGLKNAKPLSPFKKKPPLKGWYVIEELESNLWKPLAELALNFTKTI